MCVEEVLRGQGGREGRQEGTGEVRAETKGEIRGRRWSTSCLIAQQCPRVGWGPYAHSLLLGTSWGDSQQQQKFVGSRVPGWSLADGAGCLLCVCGGGVAAWPAGLFWRA